MTTAIEPSAYDLLAARFADLAGPEEGCSIIAVLDADGHCVTIPISRHLLDDDGQDAVAGEALVEMLPFRRQSREKGAPAIACADCGHELEYSTEGSYVVGGAWVNARTRDTVIGRCTNTECARFGALRVFSRETGEEREVERCGNPVCSEHGTGI